ncbi:MAG: hypothetical protein K1X83_02135 [Oligoflexia bacterium]|nr:hypothetical protein [Oligoflexia bacterium]
MLRIAIPLLLALALSSCGKYGPPVPPEALSPAAVHELRAEGAAEGVKLSWRSPEADLRGQDLKSLDGYRIYRKLSFGIEDVATGTRPEGGQESDYELLATIPDSHVADLKKLKDEALAAGKPARRLKAPDSAKEFSFTDPKVAAGKTYLYRVVPFNQGDTEGRVTKLLKVTFNGEQTASSLVAVSEAEDLEDLF